MKGEAAGQNGHEFRAVGEARRGIDGRQKEDERTECGSVVQNEVAVVVLKRESDRDALVQKVVNFLRDVKYHRDGHNEHHEQRIGSEELPEEVAVNAKQGAVHQWLVGEVSKVGKVSSLAATGDG